MSGHGRLHDVSGVGTQHHQFAMSHVDHPHNTERDGQSNGDQNKHRSRTQTEEHSFDGGIEPAPTINCSYGRLSGPAYIFIGFVGQSSELVAHILVETSTQPSDGLKPSLSIRSVQRSQRDTSCDLLL